MIKTSLEVLENMYYDMAFIMALITASAYVALIIAGLALLVLRVWDVGIWFLAIGLGIPALVILVIAGPLTNPWSFFAGACTLILVSGTTAWALESMFPGRSLILRIREVNVD